VLFVTGIALFAMAQAAISLLNIIVVNVDEFRDYEAVFQKSRT
jgi:hypothetical protein